MINRTIFKKGNLFRIIRAIAHKDRANIMMYENGTTANPEK
jgi:hypothetical protein